ncbi:hypothetical protein [Polaromonas sp.]|uniref:hypothetical protein n=1 Tax=Polaromonas sp. TaxID=1869339 RepID=UPI003C95F6F2
MASASIPPSNMALLAVLGVGAYWFATRTAQGATLGQSASALWRQAGFPSSTAIGPVPQVYQQNDNALWSGVGKILGAGFDKLMNSKTPTVYQQKNAEYNGVGGTYDGSISGDPYNSSMDGFAANLAPGFSSIYDYSKEFWY